jgi:taurine dioxygenase
MVQIRPMPVLGSECLDVDLREPLAEDDLARLREAYEGTHLLVFRGQELSGQEQFDFVRRFGPVVGEQHPWSYVSNARPDGIVREGALLFHSDFAFTATPTLGIALHALEVPANGAPTRYADAVRAVRMFPADLRSRLEGVRVRNCYDFCGHDDTRMRLRSASPGSPWHDHPIIAPHPRTGEPLVWANELHTDGVVGMSDDDSDALLAEVFAVLYADDNVYEHRWSVGDLVLWDNIALHHGRRDFPVREARTLQRVTLAELTPSQMVPNLAELLAAR